VLTVDDYGAIRRARRDGLSIRQISREFGHTRKTVRYALDHAEPPTPTPRVRKAPLLGPVVAIIDRILADDEEAPPKQRHTAAQIHRRLREEHAYPGGYAQVQRYVLKHRRRYRETFIPLGHLPGRRIEADFGRIHVDFPDGRRPVPFLVAAWAYSNAPFALALPFERTEAILEGMVAAFEFFGGVPREVWWDNPRTVATLILKGRERQVHPRYAALASHHVFEPKFCMPARGNEKPDAEGTVKAVRERFATPVPRAADLDELNGLLHRWCLAERDRVVRSLAGPFTIKDRLAEDLASASPLPRDRFEACVIHPAVAVDKYQSVAFDGNRYGVPRAFAFGLVTIKGFVDRVAIVSRGQVVATHGRSPEKSRMVLDPLHFLATLGRKPGSLDHAPVFRDWVLPACFADLRGRLERQHGPSAGARHYARVLQLLTEHPMTRLSTAIETCIRERLDTADAVIRRTKAIASIEAAKRPGPPTTTAPHLSMPVDVPPPDLSRFDQLLGRVDDSPVGVFYA
jgi:transposase